MDDKFFLICLGFTGGTADVDVKFDLFAEISIGNSLLSSAVWFKFVSMMMFETVFCWDYGSSLQTEVSGNFVSLSFKREELLLLRC